MKNCLREPASCRIYPFVLLVLGVFLSACSDGGDSNRLSEVHSLSQPLLPGEQASHVIAQANTRVEGPIAGEPVLISTFFPLGPLGYQRAEYFISGAASAYVNVNELHPDGEWQVTEAEQASYLTRAVVIRPIEQEDFNGTVLVEWLNVSAGFDSGPQWGMMHTELLRSGYAWVGISAQQEGIAALQDGTAAAILPGVAADERYAPLSHPGDSFSYDIYSQLAAVIRQPEDVSLLGPLQPQYLIASGESQSAGRLLTYVNAIAPRHALYDAYFIHSRTQGSAPLQGKFLQPEVATPDIVRVREDFPFPVLMLQTESDLLGLLNAYPSNQDDNDNFRLWEIAGSAHADLYTFIDAWTDRGGNPAIAAVREELEPVPGIISCQLPVNSGPQHFVANAALAALDTWVRDGVAPARAQRLTVAGEPPAIVRDEFGNAVGGVRTPYVDAPIATLEGEGQPQPDITDVTKLSLETVDYCFLSGTTKLFDAATLGLLYEDNADYLETLNRSTDDAVSKGFLLPADAQLIKAYAASSDIFAP